MDTLTFAHNGINHAGTLDTAVHRAASNVVWLAASAVALAVVMYFVASVLNRRQTQEIKQEKRNR